MARKAQFVLLAMVALDAACLLAGMAVVVPRAVAVAGGQGGGAGPAVAGWPTLWLLLPVVWIYGLWVQGHYGDLLAGRSPAAWRPAVTVPVGLALMAVAGCWVGGGVAVCPASIIAAGGCGWVYWLLLARALRGAALGLLRAHGLTDLALVVVARDDRWGLAQDVLREHALVVRPAAVWVVQTEAPLPTSDGPLPNGRRLGAESEVEPFLLETAVSRVVLVAPGAFEPGLRERLLATCGELGIPCSAVEGGAGASAAGCEISDCPETPRPVAGLLLKGVVDVVGGGALLVLALPVFLLAAAATRLSSPGPVLFRQRRVGLHGRRFVILKLRTMRAGAEDLHDHLVGLLAPDQALKPISDPRVTPVGRFLRRSSLDELPQLWNVVRGEMSLIGPRPMTEAEVARLPRREGRRRHAMKPGMTGLWQVSGRSRITTMGRRLALDLEYVDHWSPWLDCRILLRTLPAVLLATGAE